MIPQLSKPQQGGQASDSIVQRATAGGGFRGPAPVSLKKNYIKDKIIKCVPKHKFIAWRE